MERNRRKSIATLIVTLIFVLLVIGASVAAAFLGKEPEKSEEYPWITSDPAVKNGMLDGSHYYGPKNTSAILSYKIAETIRVDVDGKGDFRIENSGKNVCLMKVKLVLNGETIYETGYIKPDQHILNDRLDKVPSGGTYQLEALFEGFDPQTEESIGVTKKAVGLVVAN